MDGLLSTFPSLTISCATYTPALSAVKVGLTTAGLLRTAALSAGMETRLQRKVNGSPSTSVEPEPFNCTSAPAVTDWLCPAFATGDVLAVVIDTVDGALSTVPSLT